jgi:hypothetical protein
MVPANNLKTTRQLVVSYPGMKRLSIKIFSIACVICGIASIGIQVGNAKVIFIKCVLCYNFLTNQVLKFLKILFENVNFLNYRIRSRRPPW